MASQDLVVHEQATSNYQRLYYLKNKERLAKNMKANYQKNRAERLEAMRAYAEKNKQRIAEWQAEYHRKRRREKPDIYRAAKHRRRAMVAASGGSYTGEEISALTLSQGNRCAACRRKFSHSLKAVIDHVVPIALGGSNYITNIQLLCRACNRSKWHLPAEEWAKKLGRLFV